MTDINKLVENYFAPRPKTITKQMLYEIFDETLKEKEALEKDLTQQILLFLRDNGYESAQEKETTRGRIIITNIGNKTNRDAAIKKLQKEFNLEPTVTYARDKTKFIGGVLPDEMGGKGVLLRHGAAPLEQETLALTNLQSQLKELSKEFSSKDKLQIVFSGDDFSTIYRVAPQALNVPKTPKADFVIGTGKNKIYISHKAGMSPNDFGQWSGITSKAGIIHEDPEVKEFGVVLKTILKQLGINEYPSSIDIQKEIKSPTLMLQAVFGKDYGKKSSSEDNVDFVIQGDISLEPALDLETEELTGTFRIGGTNIFSRRHAPRDVQSLQGFFQGGYLPVIAVRRGDAGRRNFEIPSARGSIQSEAGRKVNFMLTENSTPENITFVPLCLDKTQFRQVKKFFSILEDKSITPENNKMFKNMRASVINYINEDCGKE